MLALVAGVGCSGKKKQAAGPCPAGAERLGDAPPKGTEEWCQARTDDDTYVKHGPYRSWHENHKKQVEGAYRSGQRHGRWQEWYRTGQPSIEGTYTDGKQTGRWLRWAPDGRKLGERDFNEPQVADAGVPPKPDAAAEEKDDPDRDWVSDATDNCPHDPNPQQEDADGDGKGDACDDDRDGDGFANEQDNCPATANPEQLDRDSDGTGDACEDDRDGDGVPDAKDNCPERANADQKDSDGDGKGDLCSPRRDLDSDGDGHPDPPVPLVGARVCGPGERGDCFDNCPTHANPDQSLSACGEGADRDGDGVADVVDNCPFTKNADQKRAPNMELTVMGAACHLDQDGDGAKDGGDNCPLLANPDQKDSNGDGIGDACTLKR